ncbi:XrtA-associated ATPase [Desulfovibrio mangrovi]|uniref:XrtA/PEP-CTERM system-associated ATPase n=1 Tax=Desulfovibrio mangrovi TaxID=2976983 RepID=UPI0022459C05|nr:XrtA/PEP-CTERM system-associated ATPase [Desulfovibrio mangrovi]UZP67545.1 XrtA-associated ATPase [Desulfovibrio mangrovi]
MYTHYFGLREKPFELLPNPGFLYPSRVHRKALAYLEYGLRERSGFILLTGEVGSGKTTIIRNLLKRDLRKTVLSKVFNTRVDSTQLISMINDDFGLEVGGRDKVAMLRDLNEFLIDQFAAGNKAVLIIDEAQNLTSELLEEVRMLSNLETDNAKLLQIILVGQPELKKTLNSPSLRQLRQRILVQTHLAPLTDDEVAEYVLYRLERAGNRSAVRWGEGALQEVHVATQGIPRLINILCDYLLLDAFSDERMSIGLENVRSVVDEIDFRHVYFPGSEDEIVSDQVVQGGNGSNGEHAIPEGWNGAGVDKGTNERSREAVHRMMKMLREMQQRLEVLENSIPRVDEGDILEMNERLQRLELFYEESALQLGRLSLAFPRLEARMNEKPLALLREEKTEQRGWFRKMWGA